MRFGLVAGAGLLLAACTSPSDNQGLPFTIAGAGPGQQPDQFISTAADVNEVLAHQYCAGGYELVSEQGLPGDKANFKQWTLRCNPHSSLF
jgi:hypothetical protein